MSFKNFFLITMLFLVASCDNSPSTQVEESKAKSIPTKVSIALVMKTLTNPFFISMENGAREAEKKYNIELIVKTAAQETSISHQIQIVEKLIRDKKVKAIVIAPGDSIQLIPVLKKAQDAGLIVVNIDNQLDPETSKKFGLSGVPFISVDNKLGAYLSAKHISENINTPTQAAILEGIRSASNAQDRKSGAMEAFNENKNISVVASETAHWKIDEGYQVTKKIFTQFPQVKLLFCANDMMSLGAIQYFQENNINDVLIASYDALDEAKQAIKKDLLQVTIDQQPFKQGFIGIETAINLLNKQTVNNKILVDVFVIEKKNL